VLRSKPRNAGDSVRFLLLSFPLAATLAVAAPSPGASLVQVSNFGASPTNARMYAYVPDQKASKPPLLVVLPYCSGTANDMFTNTGFKGEADKHGFVAIYAETGNSDGCWDVHSTQTLTHEGGGDSNTVANMVKYAISAYSADGARVYVTGVSSGAMLTDVLLGTYPDIFKGGAIFAGVPFGCFAGTSGWNSACADGTIIKTGKEWGDAVRSAYPGYAGSRPRVQIWHGTADDTLDYANFGEEIKQWTNVLGVSETPSSTEANQPQSGFTRTRYKDAGGVVRVEAVSEANQPHSLTMPAAEVTKFFGLDGTSDPGAGNGGMGAGGSGAGGSGAGRSGAGGMGAGAGGMGAGGMSAGGMSAGGTGAGGTGAGLGGSGPAGAGGLATAGTAGGSAAVAGQAGAVHAGAGIGGIVGIGGGANAAGGAGGFALGGASGRGVSGSSGGSQAGMAGGASAVGGTGGVSDEPALVETQPPHISGCGVAYGAAHGSGRALMVLALGLFAARSGRGRRDRHDA
jgi:acetylxylan esterase